MYTGQPLWLDSSFNQKIKSLDPTLAVCYMNTYRTVYFTVFVNVLQVLVEAEVVDEEVVCCTNSSCSTVETHNGPPPSPARF